MLSRLCLVVGSPIGHSLSPVLHRAAYAEFGLRWRYEAEEVGPGGLAAVLTAREPVGVSVTMPLKAEAYRLAGEVSPIARQVGVANTLVALGGDPAAGYRADNTDVAGVVGALAEAGLTSLAGARIVLVGGGGTAQAVLVALAGLGAEAVEVVARSTSRAAASLQPTARRCAEVAGSAPKLRYRRLAPGAVGSPDLVVATTPAGALDAYADDVAAAGVVFDVLYHPWPTAPVAAAVRRGATVVGGLAMLVHQAARQVELMTGRGPAPVEAMRAAGEAALAARSHT